MRSGRPGFNPLPAFRPGETQVAKPLLPKQLFQSAPGFSAGRNAVANGASGEAAVVSIRSRLFGREKPHQCSRAAPRHWVSIRSRLFGREKPADANDAERRAVCFNPLPAFRPGETSTTLAEVMPPAQFQSAPGFSAGRNFFSVIGIPPHRSFNPLPAFRPGETVHDEIAFSVHDMFQSAPGFSAGRNGLRGPLLFIRNGVSIRSRLFGREKR